MLIGLSIRDIVFIDRLHLDLEAGLNVMTGETGAGKSILLDALGLALGARADKALVRHCAGTASVSAEFVVADGHPAAQLLREQDIAADETLVLRRTLSRDGGSRAFINDEPVSAGLLRQIGETLVEIQSQGEQQSLSSTTRHRQLLDAYAGLGDDLAALGKRYDHMRETAAGLEEAAAASDRRGEEEAFVRHALEEFDVLEPRQGEEDALAGERTLLMHAERISEEVREAAQQVSGDGGVDHRLRAAIRHMQRAQDYAQGRLDKALAALERAVIESAEVEAEINDVIHAIESQPNRLEDIEQRLFALRAAARKHKVDVDDLPALRDSLAEKLAGLQGSATRLATLREEAARAREAYTVQARTVSAARKKAAKKFDLAVMAELAPLKLEKAIFQTDIATDEEAEGARHGLDRVSFQVTTIPGAAPGPLARIASGGELARFLLALRVVLAGRGSVPSLVFDEVDLGLGGATADAVGERLLRLATGAQMLVITHSPQVAARGTHHWRIVKQASEEGAIARLERLEGEARREEIARMLAGARVTEEAREAAMSLIRAADEVAEPALGS